MITIRTNSAFSLWAPWVLQKEFRGARDTRIVRENGTTAAFQSGNRLGVVGLRQVHVIGRRDA